MTLRMSTNKGYTMACPFGDWCVTRPDDFDGRREAERLYALHTADHAPDRRVSEGTYTYATPSGLPKEIHYLLHELWTKAVGTPGYDKSRWLELERILKAQCQLQTEVEAVLQMLGGAVVHVREGGGPEDLAQSLAVSVARLQKDHEDMRQRIIELKAKLDHPLAG